MPPRLCDLLLTADVLITQNESRDILHDAAVAIENGLFVGVGTKQSIMSAFQARQRMDLGRCILAPGLVNAHTHVSMTMFRGLADDLPLMEWLNQHIWPKEARLFPEIVRLAALLGCAEMIRFGVTSFVDAYLFADQVALAAFESGMRAMVAEGVLEGPTPSYPNAHGAFERNRSLSQKWRGNSRVTPFVFPHAPYTLTEQTLAACVGLSEELDCPLGIHVSETLQENEGIQAKYGKSPTALLDGLGLFQRPCHIAHGVHLSEEDMDILAARQTTVVHCPRSNFKLASGVARTELMLEKGIPLALGTDGAASNNSLNLFADMSLATLAAKGVYGHPASFPAQTALDAATLGGAALFRKPGLGSIAVGSPADCIALSYEGPNMLPLHSPLSQLVYSCTGAECVLTMVDGRILARDGEVKSVDVPAVAAALQELLPRLEGA